MSDDPADLAASPGGRRLATRARLDPVVARLVAAVAVLDRIFGR